MNIICKPLKSLVLTAAATALAGCGGGSDGPGMNTSIVRDLSAAPACAVVRQVPEKGIESIRQASQCVTID